MIFLLLPVLIATVIVTQSAESVAFPSVLLNGTFEEFSKKGKLQGWDTDGNIQPAVGAKGKRAVLLTGTEDEPKASLIQTVSLPKGVSLLTVFTLVKTVNVRKADKEAKGGATLSLYFYRAGGDLLQKAQMESWNGTLSWRPWSDRVRVPQGAAQVELRLELQGSLGEVSFADTQLFFGLPDDYDRTNFVIDGGFEYPSAFSPWLQDQGQKFRYPGYEGNGMLETKLNDYETRVAKQYVTLGPEGMEKAGLQTDVRLDQVKVNEKGGGAKIEIHFFDEQGKLLGQEAMGPWGGTQPWKKFSHEFTVPRSAHKATLLLKLENAKGTVGFDNVRWTGTSGNQMLLRPFESRTDTSPWKAFKPVKGPLQGPLDLHALLDPPAGSRGFVKAGTDGHLYFEDGTRARFFGANIQAPETFPDHKTAELYAERLSQWGFNLVRLHHLDAPWGKPNIFDPETNDTQHFSKESLDRLDYFIAQLKKRGIYVYLDLLVSRRFRAGDDVRAYQKLSKGAKVVAQYNRRIIELQKKYAQDLLTHVNPYTETKLIDEPALVLMELINESSFFSLEKEIKFIPAVYLEELKRLWVGYLKSQGVSASEAQADRYLDFEDERVQAFYIKLQVDYFREMHKFLRSLGVKIPIAGSNLGREGLDLKTNAELDFIDRHSYWDQPLGGYGDLVKFHNGMITKEVYPSTHPAEKKRINPIVRLSGLRVQNKPFVVSEWNIDWPNEYRAAGPILMAAYASFQDWDGMIQFNFEGKLLPQKIEGNFDISTKPEIFLQYAVAARLFHRQDIVQAKERVALPLSVKALEKPWLGLLHGVERILTAAGWPAVAEASKDYWTSDTNQLVWDAKQGLVTIHSLKTQAVIGVLNGEPVDLPAVRFDLKNDFASASVTSIDNKPLEMSDHLLVTALARSENAGTIYNANRTLLRSSGEGPILMEPVIGQVILKRKSPSEGKVFILNAKGERVKETAVETAQGGIQFQVGEGPLYEIVLGGES